MGNYEVLAILPGTLTDEEAVQASQRVHQILKDHGATIVKEDFWGKRKLAYEIKKLRHGFYDLVEFDLPADKLSGLDQILRLDDQVVRHQIISRVVKTPEQLAAEKQLQERLAAKRQAQKEREAGTSMATDQTKTPEAPVEVAVSEQALDEKLEEILDEKEVDV